MPPEHPVGRTGLLVDDPTDLDAFGRAVTATVEQPTLARALGRNGHVLVRRRFLSHRHLLEWAETLRSARRRLVGRRRRGNARASGRKGPSGGAGEQRPDASWHAGDPTGDGTPLHDAAAHLRPTVPGAARNRGACAPRAAVRRAVHAPARDCGFPAVASPEYADGRPSLEPTRWTVSKRPKRAV